MVNHTTPHVLQCPGLKRAHPQVSCYTPTLLRGSCWRLHFGTIRGTYALSGGSAATLQHSNSVSPGLSTVVLVAIACAFAAGLQPRQVLPRGLRQVARSAARPAPGDVRRPGLCWYPGCASRREAHRLPARRPWLAPFTPFACVFVFGYRHSQGRRVLDHRVRAALKCCPAPMRRLPHGSMLQRRSQPSECEGRS